MPHDGDKDYLEDTAMTRSEIFQRVERIGPKSVTVFLDACYTGGTRSQDVTLVASKRPIQVVALEQSVPSGFTNDGLPVGLQLVGKALDEETLLRVGYTFQQHTAFHQSSKGGA